jgi:hypothetical protein
MSSVSSASLGAVSDFSGGKVIGIQGDMVPVIERISSLVVADSLY